jgi:intein-encoded DNA endonuclease-like protein
MVRKEKKKRLHEEANMVFYGTPNPTKEDLEKVKHRYYMEFYGKPR